MSLVLRHFWKGWQEELLPLITQNFNDMTGYTQVLKAKEKVTQADQHLTQFKQSLADSKAQVDQLVDQRRKTQLQINTLLQRKDAWTDLDIERFTELYRSDLSLDVDEQKAKQGYTKASEDFEKAHTLYLNVIRERYIEEQLYSDKIRQASTWWTWGLISAHLIMFLSVNFITEPRRRRLFQEELLLALHEENEKQQEVFLQNLKDEKAEQEMFLQNLKDEKAEETVILTQEPPQTYQKQALDLIQDAHFLGGLSLGMIVTGMTLLIFQR